MHQRGTFEAANVAAMHALAARVAARLVPGDLLLLTGPLGSGKTTFVQGLAAALGVNEPVTSPTFTVAGDYAARGRAGITRLVHLDLYRLPADQAGSDPAVAAVLDEQPGEQVTVIEWAERLGRKPDGAWRIVFEHGATSDTRVVRIE